MTWRALAILVILVAAYQGFVRFQRDRRSNELSKRVLAIDLGSSNPNSVEQLSKIQDGPLLKSVVGTAWWRAAKLDISRWRYLHVLLDDRIKQAKENLTADLAEKLRALAGEKGLDAAVRREHLRTLEESAFRYFQRGELDASHHRLLLEVIQGSLRQTEEESRSRALAN